MYDYLIFNQLKKYSKANKAFHMPGHKGRGEFLKNFPLADMDVTELSWSDNLACPAGVIGRAQRDIARILGAERSYILTDGSSSGVLSMMFAAAKRGSKIIVPRNCHRSVWNACKILGIEPVLVQGEYKDGVMLPPSPAEISKIVLNDITVAGMIVTSPDYYGNIAPLKEYSEILKSNKRLLLVDGAHGAHLAFSPDGAGYAGKFADAWVDGAHKSLFALTQGAVLNLNDTSLLPDIEEGLGIFRTSSPGYPIMASVEYGIKYLANDPSLCEKARKAAEDFRRDSGFVFYPSADWTKLAADCAPYKISADKAAEELEKRGVYCEFSDGRYLLFYLSPAVSEGDFNLLKKSLKAVFGDKKLSGTYAPRPEIPRAPRTYSFLYAIKKPSEWVPLESAAGRMCAKAAGFTPPCIPVILEGEMITEYAVRALGSGNVFGLSEGMVKVVAR